MKGNKGEWSELYVLIKLLADGKLFQSDVNLTKDPDNVYEVVKAFKTENKYELEFVRSDKILVYKSNGMKSLISQFEVDNFSDISKNLLIGIKNGKGKTFEISSITDFLDETQITKIKADSSSKADIKLRIYDHRLAKETDLGFSIKSLLGGKSTLFNTGNGNNFIYKINGDVKPFDIKKFNADTYSPTGKKSKIALRLQTLIEEGFNIEFKSIQSKQLWQNLKMIDGDLPDILAYSLKYRWLYEEKSLKKISEILEENDPLDFYSGGSNSQKMYEYKIKRFLTESAMGMTSETPWFGEYDSFGGVIVAKEDGDVLCFHIYDFNIFRNYLLNNTEFEQPSTGEDPIEPGSSRAESTKKYFYGWLYENNGLEFKINLQVRFN